MPLFLFLAIVGVFVGAHVVRRYRWPGRVVRRELRALPRVTVEEASGSGRVRLVGRVSEGETLVAPLSKRACVCYLAVVEEQAPGFWREILREVRGGVFTLDDGSGQAIVEADRLRLDVALKTTGTSGLLDDPNVAEAALLARHHEGATGVVFNRRLRYREGLITIGAAVACAGRLVRELDPAGAERGYRDAPATRLSVGGNAREPLLLSDALELVREPIRRGARPLPRPADPPPRLPP